MTGIPKNPSAAFVKLNPHLFQEAVCDQTEVRYGPVPGISPDVKSILGHNTKTFTIPVAPCPAPRMTRQDRWRGQPGAKPRRPCVQAYFDYRDALRAAVGDVPTVPGEIRAVFHFAMPASWSAKRRTAMIGQPHRQRPDGDNCLKAIQDALFLEDGGVWRGSFEKRWAERGRVELEFTEHPANT